MTTKVLNLYAGIGGNRKLWEDVDVTAVEWDSEKAEVYQDHFPQDTVIEADAHEYLKENYSEYDFIWASPPCPTHSDLRFRKAGPERQNDPVYPDMRLYQEVIFLENYFEGKYAVENVRPYYEALIDPQKVGRHRVWSNYHIPSKRAESMDIHTSSVGDYEEKYGFDTSGYDITNTKRLKMLRNCVRPEVGKHVFESRGKQTTLV